MKGEYHIFLIAPDCYSKRFTTLGHSHLLGRWWRWNANFCLHDDLILNFVTAICYGKPVDLNSHWLSSLCDKPIDKPSALFTPVHGIGLFLYRLQTSENVWCFYVFRRCRKRPVSWNELICLHVACSNGDLHLNLWQNYLFLVTFQILNIYHRILFWNIAHEDFIVAILVVSFAMFVFMPVITKLILVP